MTWRPISIVPVWTGVVIAAVAVLIVAPPSSYLSWLAIIFGTSLLVTFALQLVLQEKEGLVGRIMLSIAGSVILLAVATAVALPIAGIG
ncbi:hypothetical protein [Salinibacterium sp. ZJ454]|uniref:hypothetical protein n=1 Tax=Salinibacterium sp. ZJ454 TaxID=2708339 RepID=UPI00141DE690|nr:hypothetical protein [Salinibacterium sp. ZJ454]